MKSFKKFAKITLFLLLFIAIIFGIYYFFKVIYKVEGEARLVEINLPGETQNIKFAVDEVKMIKLKWKNAILIKGWVFKENVKSAKRDVFLVLKSKNKSLVFKIEKNSIMRPDVSAGFHLAGGIHNHGFEISVPIYLLKENTYQIGFVIRDETGQYYTMFSKALRISNDTIKVNDYQFESTQVSISLKVPTVKINCNFETVNISGNNLIISGWGFLKGINSESQKSYILLKKNEKVTVFTLIVQVRKDITGYFKETHLNLDSSGFLAQIATEGLEKGQYQVGLYIEKGNQAGMIYSNKFVDIGK